MKMVPEQVDRSKGKSTEKPPVSLTLHYRTNPEASDGESGGGRPDLVVVKSLQHPSRIVHSPEKCWTVRVELTWGTSTDERAEIEVALIHDEREAFAEAREQMEVVGVLLKEADLRGVGGCVSILRPSGAVRRRWLYWFEGEWKVTL